MGYWTLCFLDIILFNLDVRFMVISIIILLRLRVSCLWEQQGLQVYNPPVRQMPSALCSTSLLTTPNYPVKILLIAMQDNG